MRIGDPVIYCGQEYVIDRFRKITIVLRPKHSIVTGECIEVTPDRILQIKKSLKFTELKEVNND